MGGYLHFLAIGLILGLFTEVQLKLIAGINPPAFAIALAAYPVILTLFYLLSRNIRPSWKGDLTFYFLVGLAGLAFEWFLLGNGPQSNALQAGRWQAGIGREHGEACAVAGEDDHEPQWIHPATDARLDTATVCRTVIGASRG